MRSRRASSLAGALALLAMSLAGQGRSLDLLYGRWETGSAAMSYELRLGSRLWGPLRNGWTLAALVDDSLGRRRAWYGGGYDLQILRGAGTLAPYGVLGAALGLSTDTTGDQLAALWSAGAGLEWHPVAALALVAEGRYRLEDRGPRGFWQPTEGRQGWSAGVGIAFWWGRRANGSPHGAGSSPPPEPPAHISGRAADVVQTALAVLGAPYQWGGTAENGFDCSGLIQYAYGQHGIRLPRSSREQSKAGTEVPPTLDALVAGDILLFSARPGAGVTHVGLYLGEGKFVHSATSGVRVSRLTEDDPEGGYWAVRWVGARRILP